MEKKYLILLWIFILITIFSLAGFYPSYISLLPQFNRFPLTIHIHFVAFLCWFLLLIIQPALIRRQQYTLHRKLGRFSYLLAPLLVLTILLLVKDKVLRELPVSVQAASMTALIGILDVMSFSVCYLLAMVNRHNIRWHVALIIGATLIVFNPGMSRLLNHFKTGSGLLAAVVLPFVIPLIIIIVEKIKYQRPVLKSPYTLFVLLWMIEIILFITVPQSTSWKNVVLTWGNEVQVTPE